MKHLLILIFLSLTIADGSAQQQMKWLKLKGPNVGYPGHKMMYGTNHEIIAQDLLGYYYTLNDGETWEYQKVVNGYKDPISHANEPYSDMTFSKSGIYYFAFAAAYQDSANDALEGMYRSTDFGTTWKQVLKLHGIYQLFVANDNSMILLSNPTPGFLKTGHVFESIDNGSSWTELVTFNMLDEPRYIIGKNQNGIFFNGELRGDNGIRIEKLDVVTEKFTLFSDGIPKIYQLYFGMNADNMLFAFTDSVIYTSDGQSAWDSIGSNYNLTQPIVGNGDTIVGQGYNRYGQGFYFTMSTNGGHTWDSIGDFRSINSFQGFTLNYENPNKLLFEDYNAIHISTNRGGSWKEIGLPYAFVDNVVLSGENIFARKNIHLPDNGFTFNQSNDNGHNWEKMDSFNFSQIGKGILGKMIAIRQDTLNTYYSSWIFDTTYLLWKKQSHTGDVVFLSYPLDFVSIVSDDTKYSYLSSTLVLYRSDNNGVTWSPIDLPGSVPLISSLDVSTTGTIYFGENPAAMYSSDDHGVSWNALSPIDDPIKLSYIKTFGSAGVLLGTEGDGLLLSNDKGNSWARLDGKNFDTVTCIAINGKGEVAAGTNRGLWISDISKYNWSKVMLGRDDKLYIGGIDVAQNDDFYVGTYGSSVWKGTRNYSSVKYLPSNHSGMQVFPNPPNGKITVTLVALNQEQIRLELYDILGRRVAVLADGRYSGEKEISFNTSDLPNGIYTLILSGAQNETQKIVVQH